MRLSEIQKKLTPAKSAYETAYEELQDKKEEGVTLAAELRPQLFVPREVKRYDTKAERMAYIFKDRAKYAFDAEGNLLPEFQKWVDSAINEAAPILANGPIPPGDNKPKNCFWTSSAIKQPSGKYSSAWYRYSRNDNVTGKFGKIGYLYKIKPGTCILELSDYYEAESIYKIFTDLERGNVSLNDEEEWERLNKSKWNRGHNVVPSKLMMKDFPWTDIAKHFDGVYHQQYREHREQIGNFLVDGMLKVVRSSIGIAWNC